MEHWSSCTTHLDGLFAIASGGKLVTSPEIIIRQLSNSCAACVTVSEMHLNTYPIESSRSKQSLKLMNSCSVVTGSL